MKSVIFTPVVTILTNEGKIDLEGNHKVMEHLIAGGVDGIVPLGSTGEFTWFSKEEKIKFLDDYIRAVDGRVDIIAGTGDLQYENVVEVSNHVLAQGIRGVMIMSEFYFNMSQDNLYTYYAYMAEHINGKICIYNFPARSGSSISGETLAKLAVKYPNIAGIKDSVTDFEHTKELLDKVLPVRPDFEVFSGFDDHFLLNKENGGVGGICALSNFAPELWSYVVKTINEADPDTAKREFDRIVSMMPIYGMESNSHRLIKGLLKYRGLDINTFSHFPFNTLKPDSLEKAIELYEKVRI